MVIIFLFAIGAVSAADDVADVVGVVDDEADIIEDVNQDTTDVLSREVEDEFDDLSVDEDDALAEDAGIGDKESITKNITVVVDGKEFNSFNYTYTNGSFDFKDLLEMCNISGDVDFNMSQFGNFSDMFQMFNDVNFSSLNKTFDFKINGEVGSIKYSLKIYSDDVNFLFDYNIICPDINGTAPVESVKRIEIFGDNELLSNITIINGNTGFDFSEMLKMFDMSSFNMSSFGNFRDMFAMFDNNTFASNTSDNKTYDFIISGSVGIINYYLNVHSNETSFVFDYDIKRPIADSILTAKDLTTATVNMALDGKSGGYLTMTLKDVLGIALANKTLHLVLDGKTIILITDQDGVAKYQINFANAGTYVGSVAFLGDDTTKASMTTVKVTVKKQSIKLAPAKTTYKFKANAKTKTVKLTLKNAKGKALKGKFINLTVKNKTFKAKTNAKGVATIKVKFTQKGSHVMTAKFAGDNTYNAISKKVKLILNK